MDDPLPSVEAGSLYHFNVVNARHWRAKYTRMANEPPVWSSGHPVEFPRACWKRASQALDPTEAAAYFAKWVALQETDLDALHSAGRLTREATVEAVLRATGCLDGDRLLIPSGQQAGRPARPEPVTLLPDLEATGARAAADGTPRRRWQRLARGRGGGTGPPTDPGVYRFFPADLSRSDLRGFHPIEAIAGEAFCWAMPEAAVRLALPPGDYEVLVHTRQLAGLWTGRLDVALGDGPLGSCEPIDAAGVVRFRVRATDFPAGESWLHLAAPPVDTTGWPGGEWRTLGVPIFEITCSPVPAQLRSRAPA